MKHDDLPGGIDNLDVEHRMELARLRIADRRTKMWTEVAKHTVSSLVLLGFFFIVCPLVCG